MDHPATSDNVAAVVTCLNASLSKHLVKESNMSFFSGG
jgi:iron-sulfur cluster repair protein YtfE (RIC family)